MNNKLIMLTVSNDKGELDCPNGMQIYFTSTREAVDYAKNYITKNKLYLAVLRKLTSASGHYRTLRYIHNPELV